MAALPTGADFTAADTTEGEFKTAIEGLRSYLAGLLGTDGLPATARTALGLAIGTNILAFVAPGASGNQLTSNGTAWVSSTPVAPVSLLGMFAKTTAGSYTATRPAGATKALIKVQGAGGGCDHLNTAGGGAYAEAVKTVAGDLTVTVGAGGTFSLGVPSAGGSSSVAGSGFTTITAAGGGTTNGGALPTTGDFNLAGSDDMEAYLSAGLPHSGLGGDGVSAGVGQPGNDGAVFIYWYL